MRAMSEGERSKRGARGGFRGHRLTSAHQRQASVHYRDSCCRCRQLQLLLLLLPTSAAAAAPAANVGMLLLPPTSAAPAASDTHCCCSSRHPLLLQQPTSAAAPAAGTSCCALSPAALALALACSSTTRSTPSGSPPPKSCSKATCRPLEIRRDLPPPPRRRGLMGLDFSARARQGTAHILARLLLLDSKVDNRNG